MRPETRKRRLHCPYCPATFCNIGNMNIHFKRKRCANGPWKTEDAKTSFRKGGKLLRANMRRNTQEGASWRCASSPYPTKNQVSNQQSLRNHLAITHRRAKTGEVVSPYCEKTERHIGNLEMRILGYKGENENTDPLHETGQKHGTT